MYIKMKQICFSKFNLRYENLYEGKINIDLSNF